MRGRLFRSLGSNELAKFISKAQRLVYFAAPGIQKQSAEAIIAVAKNIGRDKVAVTLDFDERVIRMGFGDLDAVRILQNADIAVDSLSGLRSGVLIVDSDGYVFTPTALYLEKEPRDDDAAPNALCLSKEQVSEVLARMSPASSELDPISFEPDPMPVLIEDFDTNPVPVSEADIAVVENRLANAPPVPFDVARQVRVYNAYLQYVESKLTGFSIQRRRITIPKILGIIYLTKRRPPSHRSRSRSRSGSSRPSAGSPRPSRCSGNSRRASSSGSSSTGGSTTSLGIASLPCC